MRSSSLLCAISMLFVSVHPILGQTRSVQLPPKVASVQVSLPELPLYLYLFAPAIYEAEKGMDGALLLSHAQKSKISEKTESIRVEEEKINARARQAETREQRRAVAIERAKFAIKSRANIRGLVQPVLTPAQNQLVAAVDGLYQAAAAEVEADFKTRLSGPTGAAKQALEKARPAMIAATFSYRLDEMLNDAQEASMARRDGEIRTVLARERSRRKAVEVARRKAEERQKAEQARKDAEAAKYGFGSFDAAATQHNWANAYLLSLAAHYAYPKQLGMAVRDFDDHEEFEDKFAAKVIPMGINEVEFFTEDDDLAVDAEAVVFSNDHLVVVAFRGSEGVEENTISGLKDWVGTDLNALFTRPRGYSAHAAVHTGMWNAAGRIYRVLKEAIARQGGSSKKVWITGHSLGGGMAGAFAARYVKDGGRVQGLVTFAAPRIGNPGFNNFVTTRIANIQRWVHGNDLIPMLPPDLDVNPFDDLPPYLHFGRTNNVRKDGTVRLNDLELKVPHADYLVGDMFQHFSQYYCRGVYGNMPEAVRKYMPPPPPKP